MSSSKSIGRRIGLLLLLQMAFALTTPFILLRPPMVNFPDYLTAFAQNSFQVRGAVFISFVGAALTVTLAVTLWPLLSKYSQPLAIAFVAICVVSCALDLMQDAGVMSMLS